MTTRRPVTFVHLDRLDHLEEPALQSLFDQLNREFFRGANTAPSDHLRTAARRP